MIIFRPGKREKEGSALGGRGVMGRGELGNHRIFSCQKKGHSFFRVMERRDFFTKCQKRNPRKAKAPPYSALHLKNPL